MNFFGHAVVATWHDTSGGFVLGAMLPDFATMIGARVPRVTDPMLVRGVAFHHATDKVFHDAPTFKALMAEARATLRARGLPRPSALAVGHIGVEILLDTVLAADARGVAGYLTALADGHPGALGPYIDWDRPDLADRYEGLREILATRGVTPGSGDADAVAYRVARALSSRPRLRLDPDGERIVLAWAEDTKSIVESAAAALMDEVRTGLAVAIRPPAEGSFE